MEDEELLEDIDLNRLVKELHPQEVTAIQMLQQNELIKERMIEMEKQVPAAEEIISQYTKTQYFEQEVEVMKGLNCTFRNIPPVCQDEASTFAIKKCGGTDNHPNYGTILGRRRLAHGLMKINGETVGGPSVLPINGNYAELQMADDNFNEKINKNAALRYKYLGYHGLADKLSEAYGVWERVIYNRMNGVEDMGDVLKKSTGTSTKEQ